MVPLRRSLRVLLYCARAVDQGRDPRERSRIPTFDQAAEKVIRLYEPTWRTGGRAASAEVWRSSLKRYVFPKLGRKPVSDITTADVLAVIVPIWHTKTATARRVKGRISSIMRWAIAQNYIENNPASDAVEAALPRDTTPQQHHRALPHREVGSALRTVRESNASPAAKLLFAFVTLTASRSGEARLARWSEVDLEGRVWTVPADRMKAKREHRVPLATQAVEVLTEARQLGDESGLLFPSPTGRGPLGANTLTRLCHELRLGCTPHGMRSSFRTWCSETEQPRELAEQALAHVNPNRVEAAYMRSDLFERRRDLMDAWSDYLSHKKKPEVCRIGLTRHGHGTLGSVLCGAIAIAEITLTWGVDDLPTQLPFRFDHRQLRSLMAIPVILRTRAVLELMGLSRTSLWRRVRAGDFPAPVRLGGRGSRAVGWRRVEVERWLEALPKA